jgi:hypothetical protein
MTSSCPSELDLDRYHQGEMGGGEAARIASHREGCASCRARLEQREAGFAAFGEVDPSRMVAKLHERLGGQDIPEPAARRAKEIMGVVPAGAGHERAPTFWGRFFNAARRPLLLAPVAVGVLLVTGVGLKLALEPDRGDDRLKGSMVLEVHKMGANAPIKDGDVLKADDRIRFEVSIPESGEIMVVGEESTGSLFAYYPSGEEKRSRSIAGVHQILEGASELDASRGREWIHLVWCPRPFSLDDVKRGQARGTPILAPECRTRSVSIVKE